MSSLLRHAVSASVPATSANLGPGFDTAGIALTLRDDLSAMVTDDPGILVEVSGIGAEDLPRDSSHLVVRAVLAGLSHWGSIPAGLIVRCQNRIPHGRGLGSSAAAIVGGLALARELVPGGTQTIGNLELLQVALSLEAHPDNLAAAIFGGATLAWIDGEQARAINVGINPDLRAVVAVPGQELSTRHARTALPTVVPFADAAFNAARTGMLVHALRHDYSLLHAATEDRLHQEYRRSMYPQSMALVDDLRMEGMAAFISGAGPTVIALSPVSEAEQVAAAIGGQWDVSVQPPGHGVVSAPFQPS